MIVPILYSPPLCYKYLIFIIFCDVSKFFTVITILSPIHLHGICVMPTAAVNLPLWYSSSLFFSSDQALISVFLARLKTVAIVVIVFLQHLLVCSILVPKPSFDLLASSSSTYFPSNTYPNLLFVCTIPQCLWEAILLLLVCT